MTVMVKPGHASDEIVQSRRRRARQDRSAKAPVTKDELADAKTHTESDSI